VEFADKWADTKSGRKLEENFFLWHETACRDFEQILGASTGDILKKRLDQDVKVPLDLDEAASFVRHRIPAVAVAPVVQMIKEPPRPWSR
jgi:hypothetical protein